MLQTSLRASSRRAPATLQVKEHKQSPQTSPLGHYTGMLQAGSDLGPDYNITSPSKEELLYPTPDTRSPSISVKHTARDHHVCLPARNQI